MSKDKDFLQVMDEKTVGKLLLASASNECMKARIMEAYLKRRILVEGNPMISKMLTNVEMDIQEKDKLIKYLTEKYG